MEFLILRPLSPETGYHFFGVGGWMGGWGEGRGSKVCAQKFVLSGVWTRVKLGRDDLSAGAAGGLPTGNRTADLHVCGWVHYRSAVA